METNKNNNEETKYMIENIAIVAILLVAISICF
jgi:hypothetical protein